MNAFDQSPDLASLARRLTAVRATTIALAMPLSEAECQVQSMPDASPVKWHLAHTTWFFETFVLERHEADFRPFHTAFRMLFNSYYNGIGEPFARPQRGLITRPTLADVLAYRRHVDERVAALLPRLPAAAVAEVAPVLELGLQHEQQHQELILTDVQHLLSCNPLNPVYRAATAVQPREPVPQAWCAFEGGLVEVGHGGGGFCFDNERPRHRRHLPPYALARRLVSQGEWVDFIADGAYREPRWWLSAGWDWVRSQRIEAPLYWQREGGDASGGSGWSGFTLGGRASVVPGVPVVNISCYEADAYTRWWSAQHPSQRAARLPTEAEWEHAAELAPPAALQHANLLEVDALRPLPPVATHDGPLQLFGDAWEWTRSAYEPYPGFQAWDGAVGEYNAKFMIDQQVLRGGSCVTPRSHIRASYRNFFPAPARWQFSGLRLAQDLG